MNDTPATTIDALDRALNIATDRIRPDVLLLSGGLDSSLLAALWRKAGHRFRAITVGLSPSVRCTPAHTFLPYPCNSDLEWAGKVAAALDLDWTPVALPDHQALRHLDWLMAQQNSFDLGQLNNIALIAGLEAAGSESPGIVTTGDDGDGLFGGYLHAREVPDWGTYVSDRLPHIDPPVRSIARATGWTTALPYLAPEVIDVVRTFAPADITEERPAAPGTLPSSFMDQFDVSRFGADTWPWGKIALRRVAERYLPRKIAWRPKTDLEFGSGMCALEPILAKRINPGVLMNLEQTGTRFYSDAHRAMYLRYRGLGLRPPMVSDGQYACSSCGGGIPIGRKHCPTCGHWPATNDA